MRFVLIPALLAFFFTAIGQDSSIVYREIVAMDSVSKTDIYNKVKLWVVNNFKDSKSVIQLDTDSKIVCKGNFTSFFTTRLMGMGKKNFGHVNFTMSITIKDGKYKAEIYNMQFKSDQVSDYDFSNINSSSKCPEKWPMVGQRRMDEMYAELKKNIDTECKYTLLSLKEDISKKAVEDNF